MLTASGIEKGVSVWDVSNTGALTHTDSLGSDDSLWIDAPTAMEVATIGTQTYIVLASAGSLSLSVMALEMAGELTATDHVIDSRNSRFASVSALTIVEHHGNIDVIVSGADDGIDIFVASSQMSGITQLHFDTGPAGTTIQANAAGETVSGTDGMDILMGAAGDDRLSGGGGDDVLTDGADADRLIGALVRIRLFSSMIRPRISPWGWTRLTCLRGLNCAATRS